MIKIAYLPIHLFLRSIANILRRQPDAGDKLQRPFSQCNGTALAPRTPTVEPTDTAQPTQRLYHCLLSGNSCAAGPRVSRRAPMIIRGGMTLFSMKSSSAVFTIPMAMASVTHGLTSKLDYRMTATRTRPLTWGYGPVADAYPLLALVSWLRCNGLLRGKSRIRNNG